MSRLDRVQKYCDTYRSKLANYEDIRPQTLGKKRTQVISISDMHLPFIRDDLVRKIFADHSGADVLVINGDLFDCHLISTFPKNTEIPFIIEYQAALELVMEAASNFGQVILVDGNHDAGRFNRELGKVNPTVQFLIKGSPMQHLAAGRRFNEKGDDLGTVNLPNVSYAGDVSAGSWFYRIGQTIFAHRLRGFKKHPMANAIDVANWFDDRGTKFQLLVSAHSHKVGMIPHKHGRILIDQGALCLPMDYERDGNCRYAPVELGYAIVEMDQQGNVDMTTSRPVYLGTYQEP